jgi:hypothetical protein
MRRLTAHGSDIRDLGEVAADALDAITAAIYGETLGTARALTDGEGILLVMRIPDGVDAASQLEAIQRMVGAATLRRTGVALRAGGVELERGRGLAVLAFERVPEPSAAQPGDATLPVGPVRGTG